MLKLVQIENEQNQVHIFQDAFIKSSQVSELTIMYHFQHANHDILLNILFQNFYKLFLRARNLYQ